MVCQTLGMSAIPFSLTKDLLAAFVEIAGGEPTEVEPVVVLAAYFDALAKEYGLSESLYLDVDPIERTEQIEPVMKIVKHYLRGEEPPFGADLVRARLYVAISAVASDPQARLRLNRNHPLTEVKVLHLAQIYWNLEATPDRPKLPIKPNAERDIPVPSASADFATMKWTARVNQKGSNFKSSGQSFRTQGARLAVLLAQQILAGTASAPGHPSHDLDIHSTSDAERPMEITLKGLAENALNEGRFDDAVDLSSSYLNIIQRRADRNPLVMESELAEAYLLRGFSELRPDSDGRDQGQNAVVDEGVAALEKAISSYTTLSELDPETTSTSTVSSTPILVFARCIDRLVGLRNQCRQHASWCS